MTTSHSQVVYGLDSSGVVYPLLCDSTKRLDSFTKVQSISLELNSAGTATSTIKASRGFLTGVFVMASTGGTFTIKDGGSGGTILLGGPTTPIPAAVTGTTIQFGGAIEFATDIFVTCVAGSFEANFFYI